MQKIFADPFFKQLKPVFGRGVNLGNALEAPKEGDWGVVLKELYFEKIAAAGFDTVRIPVRWSAHADESPPYRIDAKFFDRVDWAIDQALKRHLIPVVNMHHYNEIFNEPEKHAERFIAMWRQIAEHYKDYPPELAFELLNEPNKNLTAEKWNPMLSEAIRIIRPSNPTRQIVVGPVGWNGIGDLPTLELPEDDRRLVATVHYYSPFEFTHQGAKWVGPESSSWLGNKWTGSKKERQAVAASQPSPTRGPLSATSASSRRAPSQSRRASRPPARTRIRPGPRDHGARDGHRSQRPAHDPLVRKGNTFYMVSRPGGYAVLGASSEERREAGAQVGEVQRLLRDALDVVPALETAAVSRRAKAIDRRVTTCDRSSKYSTGVAGRGRPVTSATA